MQQAQRGMVLTRVTRRLSNLSPGQVPAESDLEDLRFGWGNVSWSADVTYLSRVSQCSAASTGPILECGSGLSTLLLGMMAARRGTEVWSMEHHPEWFDRVKKQLARHRLPVNLVLAPLRDYGAFTWYDPPLDRLPDRFALVICDGPPGDTPGGRYGLAPIMKERLGPGTVILLDDADREEELAIIRKWQREMGTTCEFFGEFPQSAVLTLA